MRPVHRPRHVNLNDNLAGGAHSRDDTVAWQPDCQVHVISAHPVQSFLHDQWEWLQVSAVDNLRELEWVRYLRKEFLCLHCLN